MRTRMSGGVTGKAGDSLPMSIGYRRTSAESFAPSIAFCGCMLAQRRLAHVYPELVGRQHEVSQTVRDSMERGVPLGHYRLGPWVTAREANRDCGRTGEPFWHKESYTEASPGVATRHAKACATTERVATLALMGR